MNENFEKSVINRIEKLEELVTKLVRLYQAVTPIGYKQASVSSVLLLTDTQKCNIGHMVRSTMFRGIKFLDNQVLFLEGNKIFDRCLEAANIDKVEDRNALFKAFISCACYYLNRNKGHVQCKIRAAATCSIVKLHIISCL
jgi:hypothetical protein